MNRNAQKEIRAMRERLVTILGQQVIDDGYKEVGTRWRDISDAIKAVETLVEIYCQETKP